MKKFIEKAWQEGHLAMWLFWPLKVLYSVVTSLRRGLYRVGLKRSYALEVPVVIVGNLTVGGNGKTPVVVWLAKLLEQQGLTVGIISRGYGGDHQAPTLVEHDTPATLCGDEPKLIINQTGCLMAVGRDRVATGELLIVHAKEQGKALDIIISDDGLQHYRLKRQMEIIVIDGLRRFGNNHLLPMGPMREGKWRAENATLVINNGGASGFNEELMTLKPSGLRLVKDNCEINTEIVLQKDIVAMAGIGYPQRFFDTLAKMNITTTKEVPFNDHQAYNQKMLGGLVNHEQWLLMTEKDAVKCHDFAQDNWAYVPVNAELTPAATQKILERLKEIL